MSSLSDNQLSLCEQPEKSFIISDSDEEIHSSLKGSSTLVNKNIIEDTDSEDEHSENVFKNTDFNKTDIELLNSDEEDIQFINNSHKVSIVEYSSDSECDSSTNLNKNINKIKRCSIYENSIYSHTPESKSTPINSYLHKRARKTIIYSDSDLEDVLVDCKKESIRQKGLLLSHIENDVQTDFDKLNIEYENKEEKVRNISLSTKSILSKQQELNTVFNNVNLEVIELKQEKSSDDDAFIDVQNKSEMEILELSFINNKISNMKSIIEEKNSLINEASIANNNDAIILMVSDSTNDISINLKSENKDFMKQKKKYNEDIICSSTSTSESEIEKEVLTLTKKETNNIDPLEAQKKEHLYFNIDFIQKQLGKLNKFAASIDIDMLPDKGEKVYKTIKQHQKKLSLLRDELEKFTYKTSIEKIQTLKNTKEQTPSIEKKLHKSTLLDGIVDINVKKNIQNDIKKKVSASKNPKFSNKFDVYEIPNLPKTSFDMVELGTKALETLNIQQSLTHQRLEQLHGSLTLRPNEDKKEKDPSGLKIPLMPHQQHALTWIKWREKQKPRGGILADDMGLGKTLTMVALVLASVNDETGNYSDETSSDDNGWVNKHKKYYGGTLVICPASLIKQWEAEIKNRCKRGLLSTLVFHGNNRNIEDRKLSKYNIVITTYQVLVREADAETGMYRMEWNRVIVDEAHYIRNHKSKACLAVCGLHARHRWALTGTPIQNKEMDLYAILKFLKCSPFDSLQVWKRWVDNKNDAGKQRLITIMKTLMLRRTKQELQLNGFINTLPDKNLVIIEIEMDRDENLVYQKILLFSQNLFAQFLSQRAEKHHVKELHSGKFDRPSFASFGIKTQFTKAQKVLLEHHSNIEAHEILVLLLRLRQMCCHPALIHSMLDKQDAAMNGLDGKEDINSNLLNKLHNMSVNENEDIQEPVSNYKIDKRIATNLLTKKNPVFNDDRCSSKIRAIIKTIQEVLKKGDKLIIVSQWTSFLKVVAKNLENIKNAKYAMFTGNVAVKDRQAIIDKINNPYDDVNILLLSLTAGGVGLNLVGANHLLLIDIHWNPQLEAQAQDRIYRFGQNKSVYVYKFICKETIEERVKKLQDKKLEIANHVLSGTRTISSKLTIEDLKLLFS